jgi:hypothetical protein
MALLRLALPATLILAGFVPVTVAVAQAPVDWYTDTGGGGVLAQPTPKAHNGGARAPLTATGPVDLPESDISATPPVSHAAQAEPVLGEPTRDPAPANAERPTSQAAQDAPTVTGGGNQDASDAGLIGSLPLTGLQLALVAGAGVFLLLAGAALRPRRRAAERR